MGARPIEEIVEAYWKHHAAFSAVERARRLEAKQWSWASEEVDDEVRTPSFRLFDLLLALAHAAPDDAALGYLGAGPIEDLVYAHGAQYLTEIEQCARRDRAFRVALSKVWMASDVPEVVRDRLRRFIDDDSSRRKGPSPRARRGD